MSDWITPELVQEHPALCVVGLCVFCIGVLFLAACFITRDTR